MAPIVYDGISQGQPLRSSADSLFKGQRFFVSQRVPDRKHFLGIITANGGDVVDLEKQADVVIVDHARKNEIRAGVHSWRYVTESVKNGRLEELDDHRVGTVVPSARPIGTTAIAAKSSRRPFTTGDDKILWMWVKPAETKGLSIRGNEIYKGLAEKYPHHTWQSWRDRWLKYVCRNNWPVPTGDTFSDAEGSPPSRSPRRETRAFESRRDRAPGSPSMSSKNNSTSKHRDVEAMVNELMAAASKILSFSPRQEQKYWDQIHAKHPLMPVATLKRFFHSRIVPLHREKMEWEQPSSSSQVATGLTSNDHKAIKLERHSMITAREKSPSWQPQSPTPTNPSFERPQPNPKSSEIQSTPLQISHESASASESSDSEVGEIPYSSADSSLKRRRGEASICSRDMSSPTREVGISRQARYSGSRKRQRIPSPEIPSTPDPMPMAKGFPPQLHLNMASHRSPSDSNGTYRVISSPLNVRLLSDERGSSLENLDGGTKQPTLDKPHATQSGSQSIEEWVQGTADSDGDGLDSDDETYETYETAPINAPEIFETAPESRNARLETQNLFDGHTQVTPNDLDFGLPEPEGGWDAVNSETTEPKNVPTATPMHPPHTSPSEWFEYHLRATPHASPDLLLTALECITTGTTHMSSDLELADLVYDALRGGEGIPEGVAGVWTEQDDAVLMGSHAKWMEGVRAKHGDAAVNARWEVLGVKMDGERNGG